MSIHTGMTEIITSVSHFKYTQFCCINLTYRQAEIWRPLGKLALAIFWLFGFVCTQSCQKFREIYIVNQWCCQNFIFVDSW